MSFNKYNPEDSVISSETIVRGLWNNDTLTLGTFFTSSNQSTETQKYYLDVYDTSASSSLQFQIQYGHILGSGSVYVNSNVVGNSPTKAIYGQYRNMIYGDENTNFSFGGNTSSDIYVINIARSRYKQSLQEGTFNLSLSGSSGKLNLTDNSKDLSTTTFIGSNKYYNIVSGSNGNAISGSNIYGYIFPDLGILVLCPNSLTGFITTANTSANTDGANHKKLFESIKLGASFSLQSKEVISSRYFFTRIKNQEFNYTTNPSIIDEKGNILYPTLIYNPQTFITTIGLYNDNNELLAVAKLSKPLLKDFTKEQLIRCKLEY